MEIKELARLVDDKLHDLILILRERGEERIVAELSAIQRECHSLLDGYLGGSHPNNIYYKRAGSNGIGQELKRIEREVEGYMKNPDEGKRKELLSLVRDLLGTSKMRYTGNEVHSELKELEKNLERAR